MDRRNRMHRRNRTDRTDRMGRNRARRIYSGMPARDLGTEGWLKPWSGPNGGNCVEAMKLADGRVALRQSTDPDGPALIYASRDFATFIRGAKRGEADFLITSRSPETI
jgi:hypothetical protein